MKSYKRKSFPAAIQKSMKSTVGEVRERDVERPEEDILGLYGTKEMKNRGIDDREFTPSTEEELDKFGKNELIIELIRMQELIRNCGVELGIVRKAKSSELRFYPDFVSRIKILIKVGWAIRL